MRVITVARKPLSESTVAGNVLRHGTGALNIDASRISCEGGSPSVQRRMGIATLVPDTTPTGWQGRKDAALYNEPRSGELKGRWPANLILLHREGCRETGTSVVHSSGKGVSTTALGIMNDDGWRPQAYARPWLQGSSGKETVSLWSCEPDCPVRELDVLAGDRPGMSGGGDQGDNHKTGREVIPSFNRKPSAPFLRGDTGGASRFFKQVKPS